MSESRILTAADWLVTGTHLIAWIDDVEFFSIVFEPDSQTFGLRRNNAATASVLYLGASSSIAESMGWAQWALTHGNALQPELTCEHGRTLLQHCDACDAEYN